MRRLQQLWELNLRQVCSRFEIAQKDWGLGLLSIFDTNLFVWPLWLSLLFAVSYALFLWYVILLFFGNDEEPQDTSRLSLWQKLLRSPWAPLILALLFVYLAYSIFIQSIPIHRSFVAVAMFFAVSMGYFTFRRWRRDR